MIKQINKRNILLIALLSAIIAVLFALGFALPAQGRAAAEGNDAGNPNAAADCNLTLDVNGQDATGISTLEDLYGGTNNSANSISRNNNLHISTRYISASAVVDDYRKAHTGQMTTGTWRFVSDAQSPNEKSLVIDSTCFSVPNVTQGNITVKAEAVTSRAGRFSILMANTAGGSPDLTTAVRVYFAVTVIDTMAPLASSGGWTNIETEKRILVGGALNSSGEETGGGIVDGKHSPVLEARNFSQISIDLREYLIGEEGYGRALYCNPSSGGSGNYETPIMQGYGEVTTTKFWTIRSVNNFTISNAFFYTNAISNEKSVQPTVSARVDPVITFTLNLTTSVIDGYSETNYSDLSGSARIDAFWSDTHYLELNLGELGNPQVSYKIIIPTRFLPANPQIKDVSSTVLSLNATSPYGYNYGDNNYYDAEGNVLSTIPSESGYSSIIIRPSDLVEYSAPTTYATGSNPVMMFNTGSTTGFMEGDNASKQSVDMSSYVIEKYEVGENVTTTRPPAYKIIAKDNGSFEISFGVDYYSSPNTLTSLPNGVTIAVTGFGYYAIEMPALNGKHAVTYNILTASQFAQLRADGYQMTAAKSLNPDQLTVELHNNSLVLTPNVDNIGGQTTAAIELSFTNSNSQTVTLTSNSFTIDVKAGSFWARFEDWQGWLIIAGCILGGIIIILLIVWIFIHSISKHKQDELATQAPVSSYIVKLNSTIAATQAQQRLAATQALTQASNQMLLGAGPTVSPAPSPDTLQLASGVPSAPAATTATESIPSEPKDNILPQESDEDLYKIIADYITDEELLERIFVEKYEPKGMVRRTFFKSKDLQARELEKEKHRIIERYKTPMPMDEAIMSEKELEKKEASSTPAAASQPKETEPEIGVIDLGFDPDAPLFVMEERVKDEFSEEKIDVDVAPEENRLNEVERQHAFLEKEIAELKARMDKVQSELDKNKSLEEELRERIAKAEADDADYAKNIEDLEFKLASCKPKERDKVTRDIRITEEKKERNLKDLEKLRAELEMLLRNGESLDGIMAKLNETQDQKNAESESINNELEKAKSDFEAYQDRMAKVKAKQELDAKIEGLSPLLVDVNTSDYQIRALQNLVDKLEKEREDNKTSIAAAKAQILGTTDFDVINELNTKISEGNARQSEIEKDLTKSAKQKTELNIEFKAQRRKANDFVEKNEIPLEELIAAEDLVIGNIELDHLKEMRESDREEAEKKVAAAQAVYDDLSASSNDLTMLAMEIASNIKDIEEELETTQNDLDAINAQMETASDDEKLMLMVDQSDKADKVEELKERLKQANVEGTKRKMEAQSEYDAKLDEARASLDEVTAEFKDACNKYDDLVNNTNPLDLIMSGSGIISQDQKKIEAENLKKQLEKSKNEIEQARLAAEMAQMAAEQAKVDAARASDEARAEAERMAQEAIEKAEAARLEAEEKARSELEAADQARREAEEAAEQARRDAEEAAEQARRDAEEAAEQARREAEEAAEQARREAEEAMQAEAEESKRKAQEEIDEMRRKAEEEAEMRRKEEEERAKAEEEKRKEEEERQKAENERKDAIAKKIAARKEQILEIRNGIKELKGEDDAKELREKLYTQSLGYDEDERNSVELMDFYNKTMDDIQHAGEVAKLKAENAKKPQRIVKKVTERVNRIPKKKAGARPGGARRPSSARPGARPGGAGTRRPSSARPGARPSGARRPSSARPGARPGGTRPGGTRPPTKRS